MKPNLDDLVKTQTGRKFWTPDEVKLLTEAKKKGIFARTLVENGYFKGRTVASLDNKMKGL